MSSPLGLEKEKTFEGGFKTSVFQTLWMAYKPFRRILILVLTVGFFGRLLALANTNMVGYWVDHLTASPRLPRFFSGWENQDFLTGLGLLTFAGFSLTTFFRIRFSRLSARAVSSLYDETTLRVSRFPMSFFDRNPLGRIMTRFSSDYGNIFRLFGGPLAEFFSIIFDLLSQVILLTWVHPSYLILMFFYGLANITVYYFNRHRLRRARRNLSHQRGPSIAHFAETVQGAVSIRLFEKESLFQRYFANLDRTYLESKRKTFSLVITYVLQMNTLSTIWFLLVGLYSWWGLRQGFMSVGDVGVSMGLILFSFNSIQMFFEWLTQLEEGFVGVERMDDYLRRPLERFMKLPRTALYPTDHPMESPDDVKLRDSFNFQNFDIQFRNVTFRYVENQNWIFKNLNLTIPEGQRVGIVGRTGSGKSTLLQCLSHLYPFEGEISIGFNNPSQIGDLARLRETVSYLPQDPVIFKASLRDNLDLAHKHTDTELVQALMKVGLGPWFASVGLTLEYELQEKGKNLSLGEKQLLGLARCLLQKSPILILDEATSSLDPLSEKIVLDVLETEYKGKTLIFVAHRLQTLHFCDHILWMDKGKIRMQGPPSEVLSQFEKREEKSSN